MDISLNELTQKIEQQNMLNNNSNIQSVDSNSFQDFIVGEDMADEMTNQIGLKIQRGGY